MIKLLVADDQDMVRAGLRALLANSDIKIVGEATSGESTLRLAAKHKPHLVLLDVQMPEGDGLVTLARLRLDMPEIPVLMFSAFDNPMYLARSVALGASGFLLKDVRKAQLLEAIRQVAKGETVWTREELRKVTGALAAPRSPTQVDIPLTHRETEVLKAIAKGSTNKEISDDLDISYETVKEHVQHVLRKIGVVDRTQAAIWAVRHGLL